MKKMLVAAVALLFTACITKAQNAPAMATDQVATPVSNDKLMDDSQSKDKTFDMKNCCVMRNGKMVCIKNGKEMPMEDDMKLANGAMLEKNGTLILPNGTKSMMTENQCIDMKGNMGMMKPASQQSEQAQPTAAPASTKSSQPAKK
jgi:hypothetical protein